MELKNGCGRRRYASTPPGTRLCPMSPGNLFSPLLSIPPSPPTPWLFLEPQSSSPSSQHIKPTGSVCCVCKLHTEYKHIQSVLVRILALPEIERTWWLAAQTSGVCVCRCVWRSRGEGGSWLGDWGILEQLSWFFIKAGTLAEMSMADLCGSVSSVSGYSLGWKSMLMQPIHNSTRAY